MHPCLPSSSYVTDESCQEDVTHILLPHSTQSGANTRQHVRYHVQNMANFANILTAISAVVVIVKSVEGIRLGRFFG